MTYSLDIVIPIGRVEPYLHRTINSALALRETLEMPVNLILSVDSVEVAIAALRKLAPTAIILEPETKQPRGPAHARNRGIAVSHSKLIAFLDSDDQFIPEEFAELIIQFIATDYMWSAGRSVDYNLLTNEDTWRGPVIHLTDGPTGLDIVRRYFAEYDTLPFRTSAAVFRREAVVEAGGFDESITFVYSEDIAFWARLTRIHEGWFSHRPIYRIGDNAHSLNRSSDTPWISPGIKYWSDARLDGPKTPSLGSYAADRAAALVLSPTTLMYSLSNIASHKL